MKNHQDRLTIALRLLALRSPFVGGITFGHHIKDPRGGGTILGWGLKFFLKHLLCPCHQPGDLHLLCMGLAGL